MAKRAAVVAVNPVNGMGLFQYLETFFENKIPCTVFAVAESREIRTNSAAHTQLPAQPFQALGIALPLVAEVEVVPSHHMDGSVLLHQILGDEGPPIHAHHAVKVGHDDVLYPVQPPHQVGPVRGGIYERRDRPGDPAGGVGVEGEGGGRRPQLLRPVPNPAQQGSVALVHAVKKAQGNDSFSLVQADSSLYLLCGAAHTS